MYFFRRPVLEKKQEKEKPPPEILPPPSAGGKRKRFFIEGKRLHHLLARLPLFTLDAYKARLAAPHTVLREKSGGNFLSAEREGRDQ